MDPAFTPATASEGRPTGAIAATRPMDPGFTPLPGAPTAGTTQRDVPDSAGSTVAAGADSGTAPRFGRIGQYELVEVLGHGGMGTVYKARHTKLKRWAALKVLPAAQLHDPAAVARFHREMEAVGRLDHPNIVQATDAGEEGDVHFLVMEYVEGIDLGKLVRRLGPLSIPDACEIVRQAALGLAHAFEHDLVHRDVKPSNLMLTTAGQVKLLDLGLARLHGEHPADQSLTATGQVMGTADYMAPEQATNTRSVDIRADLYSLGCTLYHLLTGRAPFGSPEYDSYFKKMLAHSQHPVPPVRELRPEVPDALLRVLERLLAKDPAGRYATPAELVQRLEPFAVGADLGKLVQAVLPPDQLVKRSTPSTDDYRAKAVTIANTAAAEAATEPMAHRGRRGSVLAGAAAAVLVLLALAGARWRDRWLSRPAPAAPDEVGMLVGSMPGLNGQWWFDEAPWLAPAVRAQLPRLAGGNERVALYLGAGNGGQPPAALPTGGIHPPHAADPGALYRDLQALTQTYLSSRPFSEVEHLQALLVSSGGEDSHKEHLAKVAAALERKAEPAAVDWHLLAVIRHKLSQWDQAEAAYRQAIAAYEANPEQLPLYALCLSDFGLMCFTAGADREAVGLFQRSRELLNAKAPPCFVVDSLCNEANARRRLGDWDEAESRLQQALEIVRTVFSPEHPFVPHLYERLAWLCMDRWRLSEAVGHFQSAKAGREKAAELGNHAAAAFAFHNRHGIAMAERFLGRVEEARKAYDLLIDDLEQSLRQRLAEPQRRALQERLLNSRERRADCELFQGAPREAAALYESTLRFGESEDLLAGRFASLGPQLQFKRAVSLALASDAPSAAKALAQGAAAAERLTAGQRQQVEPIERVARCVLDLVSGVAAAPTELRQVLNAQYEEGRNSASRDQLEVLLLAAKVLLSQQPSTADDSQKDAEAALRLARLPGRSGAGRELLAYLRGVYDAAIARLATQSGCDARELALLALEARTAERSHSVPTGRSMLVFHFQSDRGVAILVPPVGAGQVHRLPFGLTNILSKERAQLALPEPLEKSLGGVQRVAIYWHDPVVGLEPTSFPFAVKPVHELVRIGGDD